MRLVRDKNRKYRESPGDKNGKEMHVNSRDKTRSDYGAKQGRLQGDRNRSENNNKRSDQRDQETAQTSGKEHEGLK